MTTELEEQVKILQAEVDLLKIKADTQRRQVEKWWHIAESPRIVVFGDLDTDQEFVVNGFRSTIKAGQLNLVPMSIASMYLESRAVSLRREAKEFHRIMDWEDDFPDATLREEEDGREVDP